MMVGMKVAQRVVLLVDQKVDKKAFQSVVSLVVWKVVRWVEMKVDA